MKPKPYRIEPPVARSLAIAAFLILSIFFPRATFCGQEEFHRIMGMMKRSFQRIRDYRCTYESFSTNGKETENMAFRYFFKKPKRIRMEVLKGKYPGTILLYNPMVAPDRVRVKVGNRAKAFFQGLLYGEDFDLADKRVVNLRGYGVHESDWGWFIDEHLRIVRAQGGEYRIEFQGTESVDGKPAWVYAFISERPERTRWVKREVVWLDQKTYFPLQYKHYDRFDRLLLSTSYRDIQMNCDLPDGLFERFEKN